MLTIYLIEDVSSIAFVGSRGNEMTLVIGRGLAWSNRQSPPEADESLGIEGKYPMKFIVQWRKCVATNVMDMVIALTFRDQYSRRYRFFRSRIPNIIRYGIS